MEKKPSFIRILVVIYVNRIVVGVVFFFLNQLKQFYNMLSKMVEKDGHEKEWRDVIFLLFLFKC